MQSYTENSITDEDKLAPLGVQRSSLPTLILLAMSIAFMFLATVLPLRDLHFYDALLTQRYLHFYDALLRHLGSWNFFPTRLLFPVTSAAVHAMYGSGPTSLKRSWGETIVLLGAFLIPCLLYLLALQYLPQYITRRYILISTFLLGLLCVFVPVVTSSDIFSYIDYARIGVLYHQNPLTTLPKAFRKDIVYRLLTWKDQPSAYGPLWAVISYLLQWIANIFGSQRLVSMVIALRLLGLSVHLCSTYLIWSISGYLQPQNGYITRRKRLYATLAFAWNPLLLFEACVNAHVDAITLLFVLLAILLLVRKEVRLLQPYLLAAIMLALATCIKINIVLLFPGFLMFLWMHRSRRVRDTVIITCIYFGVIILSYLPFWQNGAVLQVFQVNPAAIRAVNTPADLLTHIYNGVTAALGYPVARPIGSPAEHVMHNLSMAVFLLVYIFLCWKILRTPTMTSTISHLIRWMAVVWLCYCIITPWFWPWYAVMFFGLYALIEATGEHKNAPFAFLRAPLAVHILALSLLTLYIFYAWAPTHSTIPGVPGFQWAFLRGLWAWGLPAVALILCLQHYKKRKYVPQQDLPEHAETLTSSTS